MIVMENGIMLIYVCFLNFVSSCKIVRFYSWDFVFLWNIIIMRIFYYFIGFSLLFCYYGFKYIEEFEIKSIVNKEYIFV